MTDCPWLRWGGLGEYEFDFGHVKFEMTFQHLNESQGLV